MIDDKWKVSSTAFNRASLDQLCRALNHYGDRLPRNNIKVQLSGLMNELENTDAHTHTHRHKLLRFSVKCSEFLFCLLQWHFSFAIFCYSVEKKRQICTSLPCESSFCSLYCNTNGMKSSIQPLQRTIFGIGFSRAIDLSLIYLLFHCKLCRCSFILDSVHKNVVTIQQRNCWHTHIYIRLTTKT